MYQTYFFLYQPVLYHPKFGNRENCTKQNSFCTTPKFGNAKFVPTSFTFCTNQFHFLYQTPFVPPKVARVKRFFWSLIFGEQTCPRRLRVRREWVLAPSLTRLSLCAGRTSGQVELFVWKSFDRLVKKNVALEIKSQHADTSTSSTKHNLGIHTKCEILDGETPHEPG